MSLIETKAYMHSDLDNFNEQIKTSSKLENVAIVDLYVCNFLTWSQMDAKQYIDKFADFQRGVNEVF